MDSAFCIGVLITSGILYALYKRHLRISLRDVPGPKPESFWLGNLRQVFHSLVGEIDTQWQEQYGGVVRIKGSFGDDRLWVADPKALQHIFQTSGYNYPKQPERRALTRLVADEGLVFADGDAHKRQRRAMLPAFGQNEAKSLVPIFNRNAAAITQKWTDILSETPSHAVAINVASDLSSATLDAIGEAGFDYKFGCMENQDNELVAGYQKVMTLGATPPSPGRILFSEISHYIPMWLSNVFYDNFPSAGLDYLRRNRDLSHKIARDLIASQTETVASGKSTSKDVMSILIRANKSLDGKNRLTDDELISQMRTILLAGHETTATTMNWALLELSNNPAVQTRLRSEVYSMKTSLQARGCGEFSASDLDTMPYLSAVIKEVLRMYPVSFHNHRQSARDDILPLSKPMTLKSGLVVHEIPVPKGTKVLLSITGYNRNKDVWGEDAHVFNPERWLTEDATKRASNVGVYSNLLTFSGGLRGCIGWRFALYELQSFLVELITNFEFTPAMDTNRLFKVPCLVMTPALDGDLSKGAQMPLRVTLTSR
ncbi:hypothetical protein QCA50_005353 [Cerrena zonata]|uniref:Cytochrome P450 n=1 Tax=Cerrena zonata TaxID=2478898 RepID=A0AAW0GEM6_9APHY